MEFPRAAQPPLNPQVERARQGIIDFLRPAENVDLFGGERAYTINVRRKVFSDQLGVMQAQHDIDTSHPGSSDQRVAEFTLGGINANRVRNRGDVNGYIESEHRLRARVGALEEAVDGAFTDSERDQSHDVGLETRQRVLVELYSVEKKVYSL